MDRNEKIFWFSVPAALLVKLLLAAVIPMTADESYFVLWGQHPDWGYYDHPPMTGWIMYIALWLGSSPLVVRLPAVLSTIIVSVGVFHLLKGLDRSKASLIALLYLLSPLDMFFVLMATDMPLILFSFVFVVFLLKALDTGRSLFFVLSGMSLGLAFLSKYLAVLLALSYLVSMFTLKKQPGRHRGFLLLLLSALPFVFVNLYWNYTHCWATIVFNLVSRNVKQGPSLGRFLVYLLIQIVLMTPVLSYYLLKKRRHIVNSLVDAGKFLPCALMFAVPLLVLGLLSPWIDQVGVAWTLPSYPFLYVILFFILSSRELVRAVIWMSVFSLVLCGTGIALLAMPIETFLTYDDSGIYLIATKPREILERIGDGKDVYLAADDYNTASLLSYHSGKYFMVFGKGWTYGRQDDLLTDYSRLDGENITILARPHGALENVENFFRRVQVEPVEIDGASWNIIRGTGFRFETYKEHVLSVVRSKFYNIPPWLPMKSCYFTEKYFK